MNQHRPRTNYVTPEYEDSGLFKTELVEIEVNLSPQLHLNVRQDIVIKAVSTHGMGFDVLFAGRRKEEASWLLTHLSNMRARGDQVTKVKLCGAWRTNFGADDTGFQSRRRQLIAAVWTVRTKTGARTFGELPVKDGY